MCILAIQYQIVQNAPILVAHNREEFFDRPTQPPKIQSGKPRVICGIDRKAGGTWLGVNQRGLFVVAANRDKANPPAEPRSRGLLCRELLGMPSARKAVRHAVKELKSGNYDGVNYVCADAKYGAVVYGGNWVEVVDLTPGLHLLTNGDLDDHRDQRQEFIRRQLTLQKIDSAVTFLAMASRAFARKPDASGRRGVVADRRGARHGFVHAPVAVDADPQRHLPVRPRSAQRHRLRRLLRPACVRSFRPTRARKSATRWKRKRA